MILHRLIRHHARHGYDHTFSLMQVDDAIRWLRSQGVTLGSGTRALDLGCGSGTFGQRLREAQCDVAFADEGDWLPAEVPKSCFQRVNIDTDDLARLGRFDLVICSNVLEHLRQPRRLVEAIPTLLRPGGWFYLSWTNWYSPWGGHDFSPFHYLGPDWGPRLFDRVMRRPRMLKPGENLYVTHVGRTLRWLREVPGVEVVHTAPRYFTEFWPLMRLPLVREVAAWNCAVLLRQTGQAPA